MLFLLFYLASLATAQMSAEYFDNAVTTPPQLLCNEDVILFRIQTAKPFRGLLYVDGQSGIRPCRVEFGANEGPMAQIAIRLGDCGMRRERQMTGVNFLLTFVVSFHPIFRTAIDRSFQVRCFYAMADTTVAAEMDVSTRPPELLEQGSLLNPECAFSVRRGTFDGPPVELLTVGEKIFYRWDCKPFPTRRLGMLVRACTINAGGTSVPLIDPRGCPEVPFLHQLVYQSDLLTAIKCQIKHCELDFNECQGVTPPNCPQLGGRSFVPTSVVDPGAVPTQVVAALPPPEVAVLGLVPVPGPPLPPIPPMAAEPPLLRVPFERRKEESPTLEDDSTEDHGVRMRPTRTEPETTTTTQHYPTIPFDTTERPLYTTAQPFVLLNRSREPLDAESHHRMEANAFSKRRLRDDRFIEVVSPDLKFLSADAAPLSNLQDSEVSWASHRQLCFDNTLIVPLLLAGILVSTLSFLFILTLLRNLYKRYWKRGNEHCHRVPSRVTDCTESSNRSDLSRTSERSIDIVEEYIGTRADHQPRQSREEWAIPPLRRLGQNNRYNS
ncbi:unnamed protein product, partial [Mesorhabditis spiculigera]